jgi:hypothetical protein
MFSGKDKKPFEKFGRSVSYGNASNFNESLGIHKILAKSTKIFGKDVPIIHQFGKHNLDEMPGYTLENPHIQDLINKASKVDQFRMRTAIKTMGPKGLEMLMAGQAGFHTERIIVEKYQEIGYVPGFSQDTVQLLNSKGYTRKQIGQKLGKCLLKEVHITHAHPKLAPVNLLLDEGGDEIWDLITEQNAVDYYTNLLADIGVGTDNTSPASTDVELIGTPVYVSMEAGFPLSTTTRRVDFKGSFADGVAEQAWEEFSVRNSNAAPKNLIRAIASKGTKATGEVWTLEIQITAS